jgi:serine/threonine-protein kinase
MSYVYRATQLTLDRVVALKILAPELDESLNFRARFEREGLVQAALDHAHIVPIYEAGRCEHGAFLSMRLIDGPTLKHLIRDQSLSPDQSLRLLGQVARALDVAHEAGVIHRDIKPQNILVEREDHAYLADFGLTKSLQDDALTAAGQFIGTMDYVAPEQIRSEVPSGASDCYALTCVLYECLTGEVPFPKPNEAAALYAHMTEPPPILSERHPQLGLPVAIDDVIATGMAKSREERPATAMELIEQAAVALAGAPCEAGGDGAKLRPRG